MVNNILVPYHCTTQRDVVLQFVKGIDTHHTCYSFSHITIYSVYYKIHRHFNISITACILKLVTMVIYFVTVEMQPLYAHMLYTFMNLLMQLANLFCMQSSTKWWLPAAHVSKMKPLKLCTVPDHSSGRNLSTYQLLNKHMLYLMTIIMPVYNNTMWLGRFSSF